MGALTENWLGGFRVVDDGRTSVANYIWDTGTLAWVVETASGSGPSSNVNIISSVAIAVTGPLTDAQLRASAVPVSGTFFQATQPVSGTFFQATQPVSLASTTITGSVAVTGPLTDVQLRASAVPVSAASLPLPTGASTETTLAAINTKTPALGQALMAASEPVVIASNQSAIPVNATQVVGSAATRWFAQLSDGTNSPAIKAASTAAATTDPSIVVAVSPNTPIVDISANLVVTATAAANTGVTLTLPAVAGLFHYITRIEISRTATAALAGTATLVLTTTNLPGSLAFSVGNAMVAGGTQRDYEINMSHPLKSSVANTATTIVAPVPGAAVLWRITVFYYTGA